MRLEGRVAVVTGASRGIGAAVSKAYAREGAAVVVNHLPDQRLAKLAAGVVDEITVGGGRALAVSADVSAREQVQALFRQAAEWAGPVDIVVTNAATSPVSRWHEIDEHEWESVLGVNLKGVLFCAQAAYPAMKDCGYGKIITVSSVTVELGAPSSLHYVTSKAGIVGLTRSLAREVGRDGIRVNCVMLGAIQTEAELERFPDQAALTVRMRAVQCLPDRGLAEDTVGTFVFLASSASDFMTGQVINVDGGWVHY